MPLFIAKQRLMIEKCGRSRSEQNYVQVLRIVGMSSKPLSSRQIEVKFTRDRSISRPHVYFMLGKLFETTTETVSLFAWDKFPSEDNNYNLKVLRKLNWIFRLKWSSLEKGGRGSIDRLIDIQKSDEGKIITIEHGKQGKVIIERTSNSDKENNSNNAVVTLTRIYHEDSDYNKRRKYPLNISKTHGKLYVSVELDARFYPLRYLDAVLKREPKDFAEEVELGSKDNSRNWRYVLNIRGLIRYILGEVAEEEELGKKHDARIDAMLKNLAENYLDRFPFLLYYDAFRQKYHRLHNERKGFPTFYEVEVLKRIALELQYLVHTADHVYLRYYVTRRYSEEITRYFHRWFRLGLISNLHGLKYETLRSYQKQILQIVIDYLKDEIKWKSEEYKAIFVY
jgi:hypothetical protein